MTQTPNASYELTEAVKEYSALYQTQKVPYAITDPDFKICWRNDAFVETCPDVESVERVLRELTRPAFACLDAGRVFRCERLNITGNPFDLTAMPVQGKESHTFIGTVIILEISESPSAFQNMEEMAVATFSHCLRGPISSTLATLKEIYSRECESKKRYTRRIQELERSLQNITDNQYKLLLLTQNLTHLMEINGNYIHYKQTFVNVSAELSELCRSLEETAMEKNIDFYCEIPSRITTNCHIELIKEVILYLTANAFYCSGGKMVNLKVAALENSLQVTVQDHGCGIDPEDMEHIFDPFFSKDPYNGGIPYSNGLGLPIVKRAVESVGGSLTITSSAEIGTSIIFEVPCSQSSSTFMGDSRAELSFKDSYSDYKLQMLPVIGSPRISEL